jgi:hypothetical protein
MTNRQQEQHTIATEGRRINFAEAVKVSKKKIKKAREDDTRLIKNKLTQLNFLISLEQVNY